MNGELKIRNSTADFLVFTKDAREVNPDLEVISISTLKGDGLDEWCDWLRKEVADWTK